VGAGEDVPVAYNPAARGAGIVAMITKANAGAVRGGRRGLARTNVDASAATSSGGRQLSDPSSEIFPFTDLPTHWILLILTGSATGAGGETLSAIYTPAFYELNTNNGLIYALGSLTATLYDSGGAVLGTTYTFLALRVRVTDASCSSVTLTFGPNVRTIDGVSFLIPAVSTTITAQPDVPLVADELCAIADLTALTNPPGSAYALAQLLTQLQIAYTNSIPLP
jgi:hypothetical protein